MNTDRAYKLAEFAARDQHKLLRYLRNQVRHADSAEDIVQETYARLLARENSEVAFLPTYLWQTAKNLMMERARLRKGRARLDKLFLQPSDPPTSPSPEELWTTAEQLALAQEALQQLPPKCVEAFELRVVEGRKFEDIAARMKLTDRMVKIHVARATQFCKSYVDSITQTRIENERGQKTA